MLVKSQSQLSGTRYDEITMDDPPPARTSDNSSSLMFIERGESHAR
jgi:hypothetical protein